MKIKSLVPWYGSKRTLAPRIIQQFGPHSTYVEPFAGSLAVLLAKQPARHEVVSDLHADLINLLRVLCDYESARQLHGFLALVPYCETLYLEAFERLKGEYETPIERARDYMIVAWQGRNGLCGTTAKLTFARRMTSLGGGGAQRWNSVLASIPDWHQRLCTIEFHQRDAFATLAKLEDKEDVLIYFDPPYLLETRSENATYQHEFSPVDHERLAAELRRFKRSRVIVSYYQSEATDNLYPGWTAVRAGQRKRRKFFTSTAKKSACTSETERSDAQECVYINGDIYPEA